MGVVKKMGHFSLPGQVSDGFNGSIFPNLGIHAADIHFIMIFS